MSSTGSGFGTLIGHDKYPIEFKRESKTLYNVSSAKDEPRWSQYSHAGDENQVVKDKAKVFPIVVYVEKNSQGGYETLSVEINSPYLKETLQKVLVGYPGMDQVVHARQLVFKAPFYAFFHSWDALRKLDQEEWGVSNEVGLLVEALKSSIEPLFKITETMAAEGIKFGDLWAIYIPGKDIIIYNNHGVKTAAKLVGLSLINKDRKGDEYYGEPGVVEHPDKAWQLELLGYDFDGKNHGYVTSFVEVKNYKGSRNLEDLLYFPLRLIINSEAIKISLVSKGRKFESLLGCHVKKYDGKKITGCHGTEEKYTGRVIIDTCAYSKYEEEVLSVSHEDQGEESIQFGTLNLSENGDGDDGFPVATENLSGNGYGDDDFRIATGCATAEDVPDDDAWMLYTKEEDAATPANEPAWMPAVGDSGFFVNNADDTGGGVGAGGRSVSSFENRTWWGNVPLWDDTDRDFKEMTDFQRLISPSHVKGFDLENKTWCELDIDCIHDIEWNDSAFGNLVLPGVEKDIILALLERPKPKPAKYADNIRDKGKAIIMLLSGPPGVGKTLTVQSVSEQARLPLYTVSAGELSGSPIEFDKALERILDCCTLWNAVLLIDEADVFLEARSTPSTSMERNELVSIFLRRLEYYQGFMFLTTNRASAIDKAFESRIDLVIPYEEPDISARRLIWEHALISNWSILGADFDTLAVYQLNGREIKSAIKLAEILAVNYAAEEMGMEHLKRVLDMKKRAKKSLFHAGDSK